MFIWDGDPVALRLGPVLFRWYGLLFAGGFIIGYFMMYAMFKRAKYNTDDLDRMLIYIFLGTLIGARLAHCLIYEPDFYLSNPLEILYIWKGGLASHGGTLGVVLAFFIFFGLSGATGITIPDFAAGIITLTLNASAYIAEIVRGGIIAVPVGQMEASRSLGLSYGRTMQKIILPQAIKIMIPSFVNQFVISLKDTTIISVIGVVELLQTGKIIVASTLQSTYVYFIIAVMYLIIITALTRIAKLLEKKVK